MNGDTLRIFSGSSHPALAEAIAAHLGVQPGHSLLNRFADGEIRFQVEESARGMDVFLVQPTCAPVNDNLMELLIMIRCLPPGIGGTHHAGHALLWLRPPGQENQAPRTCNCPIGG
jgi:phosphoribosylpyrophosphate synthetase